MGMVWFHMQYILETSVYPREPEPMKELREITAKHPWYNSSYPIHQFSVRFLDLDALFFNSGVCVFLLIDGTKRQEHHDNLSRRRAILEHVAEANQCEEHHGNRCVHRLLPACHCSGSS